jgi:hypothetical protein
MSSARVCLQNEHIDRGRELISSTNSFPQSQQTRKVLRGLYIAVISNERTFIAFFVIDFHMSAPFGPALLRRTCITNNQCHTALITNQRCTFAYPNTINSLSKHKEPQTPTASLAVTAKYGHSDRYSGPVNIHLQNSGSPNISICKAHVTSLLQWGHWQASVTAILHISTWWEVQQYGPCVHHLFSMQSTEIFDCTISHNKGVFAVFFAFGVLATKNRLCLGHALSSGMRLQ